MGIGEADPNLTVHQETVVHVDDSLPLAVRAGIDLLIFLAFPPSKAVCPQQISVFRLQHMFLGRVSEQSAEVDKVGGIPNRGRDSYRSAFISVQGIAERMRLGVASRPTLLALLGALLGWTCEPVEETS